VAGGGRAGHGRDPWRPGRRHGELGRQQSARYGRGGCGGREVPRPAPVCPAPAWRVSREAVVNGNGLVVAGIGVFEFLQPA
jgi:hypothetical protein